MSDRILSLPITAQSLQLATTPQLLHTTAMKHLPQMGGMSSAIRADTATLLRLDLPSDPLGRPGRITLRLRGPAIDQALEPVETLPLVDGSRLVLRVAASARARDQDDKIVYKPLSDDRFEATITRQLRAAGMEPADLAFSPAKRFGQPGNGQVWLTVRDITTTITITDPALAEAAHATGIGRGRAYGLGMPVVVVNPTH